jgi:hypothetical protein
MGRTASLVLISSVGELLGMLPAIELECPYWPESADVVAEAEARFSAQVVVLRLLDNEASLGAGGAVSYLAELRSATHGLELLPIPLALRERAELRDSKRMPWAELGGPDESLAWARAALTPTHRQSFRAVQRRTWNLSTLWRFEAPSGATDAAVWLKQVPHFMQHESRVLRWLNAALPGAAPTLVAADDCGRSLLDHVAGEDLYGVPVAIRQLILERLHGVQRAATHAVDELLALGVPDLRGSKRAVDSAQKLLGWMKTCPDLPELLRHLEQQLELLDESGLPATLVHSDNHPGNARGHGQSVTLLDWGECFIGHPVTDLVALLEGLSPAQAATLSGQWCAAWKALAPRSRPELALEAAPFVAAMHGAATYAHFLQQIEVSEWPYHQRDVPRCLEAAAELSRRSRGGPRASKDAT